MLYWHRIKIPPVGTHLRRLLKLLLLWFALLLVFVVLVDAAYLALIWPDWETLAKGSVPKSKFITHYEERLRSDLALPPLQWQPVRLKQIAPIMGRTVIVAEDSRFYQHAGVDPDAILTALKYNFSQGKVVYGASTISQQTAKNMFLHADRDPLRKWHELLLTTAMEKHLTKHRILELYLNSAEFGRGIYGVEAAARHYWGISADALGVEQAIQLAATLPSPVKDNPATATAAFEQRVKKIANHMRAILPRPKPAPVEARIEAAVPPPMATPPPAEVPTATVTPQRLPEPFVLPFEEEDQGD